MVLVLEDNEAKPEAEISAVWIWLVGCRQTGTCSNAAVKRICTAYVVAELQDGICVTNLQQQSYMQFVRVSEPVQFGNLSGSGDACSICVHDDSCALAATLKSSCRAAADLLQQLCLTLCVALKDFVDVLSSSRSPPNLNLKGVMGWLT